MLVSIFYGCVLSPHTFLCENNYNFFSYKIGIFYKSIISHIYRRFSRRTRAFKDRDLLFYDRASEIVLRLFYNCFNTKNFRNIHTLYLVHTDLRLDFRCRCQISAGTRIAVILRWTILYFQNRNGPRVSAQLEFR